MRFAGLLSTVFDFIQFVMTSQRNMRVRVGRYPPYQITARKSIFKKKIAGIISMTAH